MKKSHPGHKPRRFVFLSSRYGIDCQTEQLIVSTTYADGAVDEDSDRRMKNAFIGLAGTDPGGDCRHSYL
jgi:hypothetical protein